MQIRVHDAFSNTVVQYIMLFFQAFNGEAQSTFCNIPGSSFKALWLSPDLKSSSPPSFLHRNKKNPADEFFIFSTNPNKCHRGAKDFIFSNLFWLWSGASPVPPVFPPLQDLDDPNLHASHTEKLFNRNHRPGQETPHLWQTTDHSATWEYAFRVDQQPFQVICI